MTRKEVIGNAELWLGDCMEILPTLPKVDAVITDPPYGINFQTASTGNGLSRRNVGGIVGDAAPFDPSHLTRWPCVLFGGNHFYARLPDGGTFHVWDKAPNTSHVDSFSDAEFVWTSWRGKSQVCRYLWKGMLQAGEKGEPKYHVAQKPIEVMRWCLGMLPSSAAVVLDPYMGSGSTGVAATQMGLSFVGCEIESHYFDIACRRIEQAYKQRPLFDAQPVKAPEQMGIEL
jgi:site-specific DNA-methyltransferase (adenine-specific)